MKTYKKTKELNDEKSPSTGSCTSFYGKSPWSGFKGKYMFLEISDCSSKVRLHNSKLDNRIRFIKKLKLLRSEIDEFIDFLEQV